MEETFAYNGFSTNIEKHTYLMPNHTSPIYITDYYTIQKKQTNTYTNPQET